MNLARQLNPGMNRRAVMRYLGLPKTSRRDEAQPVVKSLLVAARRNNDDDTAAVLSQVKSFVNRLPGKCEFNGCDSVQLAPRCFVHAAPARAKSRSAVAILLLAVFCASCKTEMQQVKIQKAPVPVALSDIPQRSVARAVPSPQSVVPSPPRPITLSWDYPPERLWEVQEFRVYSNTTLAPAPWPLWVTTTNQFISFMPTNTSRFFYCTAYGVNETESLPNTK